MKLLWNLVCNDIRKNRIMSAVLTLFLLLSAILMAGGLRVTGIMLSATGGLNQLAAPPDFLQMHKGEYDAEAVQEFAAAHSYIQDSLVVSMLNIDNAKLLYQGETLEGCLMDNGFIVQNKGFDYLLDTDNQVAMIQDGEIGVPVCYHEELGINVGDTLTIRDGAYEKNLTVVTLIRDAQMNAALTSSKRFLVSEAELRELSEHTGEWEYSFEYLLKPGTDVTTLERDYLDEQMPSNGVAITGGLLDLLNSLSYGLIAFLLLAISLILILIALLCLSYIIRATLAEEHRTIGTMKAIGLSMKAIQRLYLMKYMTFAIISGLVGYFIAIPFGNACSGSVLLYCGEGVSGWMQWVYPLLGVLLLEGLVILRCRRMIRKNLKSTVVELLRDEEHIKKEGRYHLPKHKWANQNLTIALGELSCKWKEYIVLFLVFLLAALMILIPINMQITVSDPSFITYMGIGKCDIRIDIQKGADLEAQKDALSDYLRKDTRIKQYTMYQNGFVQIENTEGEWEYLRISSGDETVFPLNYLEGRIPKKPDSSVREMALSYMEASNLHLKTGDTVRIRQGNTIEEYTVSGIYQDITYSGKTGKAPVHFSKETTEGYVFYLQVQDGVSIIDQAEELRSVVTGGRVTPITEFIQQTLGGVIGNMWIMIAATLTLSVLLIILITTMFLQLITAREHSAIAIKKSIGFTNQDIRIQLGIRIFLIQAAAIIAGIILTSTLGEGLFGMILSSLGAAKITLLTNPVITGLACPAGQLLVCIVTTVSATGAVKKYHIRDQIME